LYSIIPIASNLDVKFDFFKKNSRRKKENCRNFENIYSSFSCYMPDGRCCARMTSKDIMETVAVKVKYFPSSTNDSE